MRIIVLFLSILFTGQLALAQGPRVPATMEFAGMKLHLNEKARREIQTDVDNIRRSEKYFQKRVEKINLHFPIIERIFKEEKLPDDFKYLVIQESALVSDAVSSSKAVGFWQFKKETGLEMHLRIDNMVDERLNLASSSRAAAGYMKKNNFYFNNWVYALLAYNTGRGGAERYISEKNFGKKRMDITGKTHWYVKKFLAHKIAYQDEIGKSDGMPFFLFEYTSGGGKSLKEIAKEFEIDSDILAEYNKCFKKHKVPSDKKYSVLIPIGFDKADQIAKKNDGIYENGTEKPKTSKLSIGNHGLQVKSYYSAANQFPKIENTDKVDVFEVNRKKGTIAKPGDNFDVLAIKGGVSLEKFLVYNDLTSFDKIQAGQVYYFENKGNKAKTHYHTLIPGQTLWDVSQKYGIKLRKLLVKNRLEDEGGVKAGLVLWLRYIRPKSIAPEYHDVRHLQKAEEPLAKMDINTSQEVLKPKTEKKENIKEEAEIEQDSTEYIEIFENSDEERQERKEILTQEVEELEEVRNVDEVESEKEIIGFKKVTHKVEKGDTYFSISKLYQVDITDLLDDNHLKINDVLSIGQELHVNVPQYKEIEAVVAKVEESPVLNDQIIIHKVSGDDTLYGIAKKYEVTIKEIMEWNGKEDFIIKPEEELKIILK